MPTAALLRPHLYHFENFAKPGVQASNIVSKDNVDRANGIIRKVAVITNGVSARGHDMEVDQTTLKQLHALAKKKGKVSVKLDHGSGISSVCGHLRNFSIIGEKLVADWYLLKTHKEYETTMERAVEMPECFGMSAAFMGGPVLETGEPVQVDDKGPHKGVPYVTDAKGKRKMLTGEEKKLARATELRAVDCVTDPAANPDGLFESRYPEVDTGNRVMPKANTQPTEPAEEPTLAEVLAAINAQNETITAMRAEITSLKESANPPEYTLDQLDGMTDAELEGLGITRQQVVDAVNQANAAVAEENSATAGEGAGTGGGEGAGEGVTAGMSPAAAQAFSSLQREVRLMAAERNAEKRQAKEKEAMTFFDNLETQVELAEKTIKEQAAKIEALELSLKTGGGKAVKPGTAEVVLFQSKNGKQAPQGTFEGIAAAKFQELKAKVGQNGFTELNAKSQAIDFARKEDPDAYADYRQRGGRLVLA